MKKQNKAKKMPTKEELIKFVESETGAKVLDIDKGIMEYEGKKWRPITDNFELLSLAFENVSLMEMSINDAKCLFAPVDYQS